MRGPMPNGYTRERRALVADTSLSGDRVAREPTCLRALRALTPSRRRGPSWGRFPMSYGAELVLSAILRDVMSWTTSAPA